MFRTRFLKAASTLWLKANVLSDLTPQWSKPSLLYNKRSCQLRILDEGGKRRRIHFHMGLHSQKG